ncbi:MAG: adenylate/guanylate cyclase domain-containing protein [Planctomycetes bacterium]|nr:adenylate/guanylate cyclase domain-containing protein [Planctomycetota bacterium]
MSRGAASAILRRREAAALAPLAQRTLEAHRDFAATPTEVWEVLAHTDRLNRNIGLPRVSYGPPRSDGGGLYREASARVLGLVGLRWREYPFDWVRLRRYTVTRVFDAGPLARFHGGAELESADGGTHVRVFAEVVPSDPFRWPLARAVARKGIRDTLAYCGAQLAARRAGLPVLPSADAARSSVRRDLLRRHLARLAAVEGMDAALVARLGRLVEEGGDDELVRLRPYALADAWGVGRAPVLRLLLHATREGMFVLAWVLLCPNCRVSKAEGSTLADLESQVHCETCGVSYDAEFDRSVELRFSVHPAVRAARDQVYCLSGPGRSPHVLAQQRLSPGEARELEVDLAEEPLRVRTLGENRTLDLRPGGPSRVEVEYLDGGFAAGAAAYAPGRARVVLRNASARPIVAVLERSGPDPAAATAAEVMALQEFRRLFGSEALAPGREMGVRSVTVLFTDLKGSTALYEQVGDAPAWGRVWRHFDYLEGIVGRHRGALVKTIGDAVMAVFQLPEDGVRAALETQAGAARFNREAGIDPPLVIKVGLHRGPAIAMNANGRLDYFGRTVNIAARIQGESEGGDVVLSEDLAGEPEVREAIRQAGFEAVPCEAELKGIEGRFRLVRLWPPASD